jgi:hypothetical protein
MYLIQTHVFAKPSAFVVGHVNLPHVRIPPSLHANIADADLVGTVHEMKSSEHLLSYIP